MYGVGHIRSELYFNVKQFLEKIVYMYKVRMYRGVHLKFGSPLFSILYINVGVSLVPLVLYLRKSIHHNHFISTEFVYDHCCAIENAQLSDIFFVKQYQQFNQQNNIIM